MGKCWLSEEKGKNSGRAEENLRQRGAPNRESMGKAGGKQGESQGKAGPKKGKAGF